MFQGVEVEDRLVVDAIDGGPVALKGEALLGSWLACSQAGARPNGRPDEDGKPSGSRHMIPPAEVAKHFEKF